MTDPKNGKTEQKISDSEIREEIARARRKPRHKKPAARRKLIFAVVLAAVLFAAGYSAYRGLDGVDSLRRLTSYRKTLQNENGRTELFRYDSDRTARFASLGDGLLIVSATRVQLLNKNGEELFSRTVNFKNPAVEVGGSVAAVYDVGGTELYLLGKRGFVRDMSAACDNGLISVSLNASDDLALATLKSGSRAAVTVYDASGAALFAFLSSERYVSDACVLDDGKHLAAVTLGEEDGVFASTLTFYAFDSEKPLSSTTLGGSMVLALKNVGGGLAAIEDDRVTLFSADGALSGSCRYDYPYLRALSAGGSGFTTLLLSRYRSGSAMRLVTVDMEGAELGTLDARREIVDVSAAGNYVAVLYGDSLTILRSDLSEYATLSGTDYARRVVMRADGSALLLGSSRAWLYAP